MKKTIILTENQLKNIIINQLLEDRKPFFISKNDLKLPPEQSDRILKYSDEWKTRKPQKLYDILKRYLEDASKYYTLDPKIELEISNVMTLLKDYYDIDTRDLNQVKSRRNKVEPSIEEPKVEEPPKPKFADRFKFKPGDLRKFGDE